MRNRWNRRATMKRKEEPKTHYQRLKGDLPLFYGTEGKKKEKGGPYAVDLSQKKNLLRGGEGWPVMMTTKHAACCP